MKQVERGAMAVLLTTAAVLGQAGAKVDADYPKTIEQWRSEREAKLKADDGWLTVAGLYWLEPGENRAGADPDAKIALPDKSAPRNFGTFMLKGEQTTFEPAPGVVASVNGEIVKGKRVLQWDPMDEHQDKLTHGDLTMFVIKRGERFAIRLRDKNSSMRREFSGLHWYPVNPSYRVEAKWVAYPAPRKVGVPNVVGIVEQQTALGYAQFRLNGRMWTLEPVVEGTELFYVFKDQTAGKETYPAGRFAYSEMPKNGKVTLDFNKAYTPPCAFTPYATCPLPSKRNQMATRIEAGELKYGNH